MKALTDNVNLPGFDGHILVSFYDVIFMYKYVVFRRKASSGMLRRVALVRTDVSKELSGSFTIVMSG
jgi:hypothetical protein